MKKHIILLFCGVVLGLFVGTSVSGLPVTPAEGVKPTVEFAVADGARGKLLNARKVVVLFTGMDPLRSKVMEDAISLGLMNNGLTIISRSRLDTLIAEKLNEQSPAIQAADAASTQGAKPAATPPKPVEPVGAVDVAKAAGAQIVILGTMLDERQRSALVNSGKPGQSLEQPQVVVTSSVQVLDVETNTVAMTLLGYWPDGTDIPNAANELVKPIIASREP